jgi:hypothetical protein
MNNHDKKYQKYFLVKEMLAVVDVLTAMEPLQIFDFVKHIKQKKVLRLCKAPEAKPGENRQIKTD